MSDDGIFWSMLVLIFTLVMVLVGVVAVTRSASAHGWYEKSCCHEQHCGPVTDDTVHEGKEGVTVRGFGILSYTDQRLRWSQDNQNHLCINGGKLLCVYRRPNGM